MSLCWGLGAKELHDGWELTMAPDQYDMISLHIINCPCINTKKKVQPQTQSTTLWTSHSTDIRFSTNSSYYCYCGETENLLIPISISHQGSEQLQSHLKAIDCGFKSKARQPHLQQAGATSADQKSEM